MIFSYTVLPPFSSKPDLSQDGKYKFELRPPKKHPEAARKNFWNISLFWAILNTI